jgi:hypothetical protein
MVYTTNETLPLTERLLWIVRECIALSTDLTLRTITDERITGILLAMQSCKSEVDRNVKINLVPDFCRLDNHQVRWRPIMEQVAKDAVWLLPETRQAIAQFVESLPIMLTRDKYEITFDCFSSRIPQWRRDLAHFAGRPNLKFLEIGSLEGYSAGWLLDNILTHSSSHLVCVDIFDNKRAERLYDLNIARSRASHRVTKLVGRSEDVLVKLDKDSFDFVYVDGSHEQVSILQDGVMAWRLLKNGGLLTFDDYQLADDPLFMLLFDEERPEIGIDAFLTVFKNRYRLIHSGHQVTIQKL